MQNAWYSESAFIMHNMVTVKMSKKNNNSDTAKSTNKRYLHIVDDPYGTHLRDTTLAYVGIFKCMCLSGSATKHKVTILDH